MADAYNSNINKRVILYDAAGYELGGHIKIVF